jgi:diguanylate cyclase (GGDEF)-like protein/putative nucleotidyltransferase with HDIG domain
MQEQIRKENGNILAIDDSMQFQNAGDIQKKLNELERELGEKSRLVEQVTLNSIMAIANTIDAKDEYTSGHSVRVANGVEAIARRLGWDEKEIQNIHYVALLHDIGKIGVPDAILNKPSRLSEEEFAIIKKHPVIGSEILKDIRMIRHVVEGALYHHERYDGKGYPYGLEGKRIPIYARIVGIADAYDAMTSNRVYRPKLSDEKVLEELERGKGRQFDPDLAQMLIQMIKEGFSRENLQKEHTALNECYSEVNSTSYVKLLHENAARSKESFLADPLTGLYSCNYVEQMVARLIREGHTGTLLVMDIDNFKRINDSYGHIAGDNTLRIFAKILKRHSRETDIVGRIGGDEFVVFFVDVVDREIITQRARELLDNLERQLLEIGYGQNCSASIGIAVYPFDGKEYNTLYNNADKSLYYVKRNGKNNFGFYSDEKGEETHQIHTTDLNNIRCMIEGKMMPETGVFQVEYEEFPQIYSYISRGIRRNHQDVQILLFTLAQTPMNRYTDIVSDEAMMALKNAVARSLRMVDVGTRYSNVQYIVILMDTNMSNGARVAERVIEQFYKIYAKGDVSLSYDIQTMRPKSR